MMRHGILPPIRRSYTHTHTLIATASNRFYSYVFLSIYTHPIGFICEHLCEFKTRHDVKYRQSIFHRIIPKHCNPYATQYMYII